MLLSVGALAQPIPIYQNFGLVTESPQIDALAFANYGTFSVSGFSIPYDFTDVQYYTNRGTMTALPGFRFDTSFSVGVSQPAVDFVNEAGASIQALDRVAVISQFSDQVVSPSYLLVSAQNIANHGIMQTGAAGLLQLTGTNIDVSRGGLGIGRIEESSTFSANIQNGTYFPDPGIYDVYWGGYTNAFMRVGSLLSISKTATNVTSPPHAVTNSSVFAFPLSETLALKNPISSVLTNVGGSDPTTKAPTNIMRQAAFIAFSDTNFVGTIKWAPSPDPAFSLQTAIIEIKLPDTNVITGNLEYSTLYLMDTMASSTNYLMLTNQAALPETYLPATYQLTRQPPFEWFTAAGGKGSLTNTFFYNSGDTNFLPVVTNLYAAYSARIDDLSSEPPAVPLLDPTQYPGRVEITGENVDLTRTRIRGTGLVSIKAANLISATNMMLDAENVLFNMAVPSGDTLNVQGTIPEKVVRLNGSLRAWSAIWTNYLGIPVTIATTDASGNATNVATNQLVEIDYHALIVDATGLLATKPVITHDLVLHGDAIVLNDPLSVVRNYFFDTTNLTLNAALNLNTNDWYSTNAPSLKSLTIGKAGSITVGDVANLGEDIASGYDSFVNNGTITANGILIKAASFTSSGTLNSLVDGITIEAQTAQFLGASTLSSNDLAISAENIRFSASTNLAAGAITITASGSLSDSGAGANNLFGTTGGFNLPVKPGTGDLLGTTIGTFGPRFQLVNHVWAGEDRGPNASGFQDNVAIGTLVLDGDTGFTLNFTGATGKNGMYVQYLQLNPALTNALAAGNLSSVLTVDPSLTIYFADSNVDPTQLQDQSGGRLVKVDFVGAASYVQVPTRSGATQQMSAAVRESTTIDSDGDGIPNAYDPFPLDPDPPLRLAGSTASDKATIALTFQAQGLTTYQVEYSSSLQSPNWQSLSTFTNQSSTPQTATVQDQLSGDHSQRYYRVRLTP
jgi:hypothetical protein